MDGQKLRIVSIIFTAAISLAGCATWSTSDTTPSPVARSAPAARPARVPESILVTEKDITDRQYDSLGDISVTVNKTTIFNADPTPELVNQKLREKAAAMGADAVIQVRYGTPGISFFSWGSLDGKGRAVSFR
jgi:uncharacterized protein YbjQ (UPF0145 family)